MLSLMLVVICPGSVVAGTLLVLTLIVISRALVNHDGRDGTAPDPLVWSAGAHPKRRRLIHAVRDRAFLPGPPGNLGFGNGFTFLHLLSVLRDIARWHYTLVFWLNGTPFLGSLHWPAGGLDL